MLNIFEGWVGGGIFACFALSSFARRAFKIAGSFKLPTLTVRQKTVQLPTFEWALTM